MTLYKWSRTAELDATADPSINWQEGQAPSSVNDSARAMMAAMAKYRDDTAGAILTGGTSTAYAVSSNQVFDTLARLHGQMIAFVPHLTNGATVTLNVDSLGAKPLRSAPSTNLLAGVLIAGTPYTCSYNNSDGAFYLRDFHVSPFSVPLGGGLPYFGLTAPNSAFAFPYGQAISRTTYQSLFNLIGTTYGSGDGSTFNLPDLRGRVVAGKDDMGGSAANRITNSGSLIVGTTLGASGGAETVTLAAPQIPAGVPSSGSNAISVTSTVSDIIRGATASSPNTGGALFQLSNSPTPTAGLITSTGSNSIAVTSTNAGQTAVNKMPPTIICNYILRII
jgi:microcystin-dependent protein